MSERTVLDASAVLAFLQGEPGAALVGAALQSDNSVVSAANQAEIVSKLLDREADKSAIDRMISQLGYTVVDVTVIDGDYAGSIRTQTRAAGLSLGDRLCLALGKRLGAVVLTADRAWVNVAQTLGVRIRCIRPDVQ